MQVTAAVREIISLSINHSLHRKTANADYNKNTTRHTVKITEQDRSNTKKKQQEQHNNLSDYFCRQSTEYTQLLSCGCYQYHRCNKRFLRF